MALELTLDKAKELVDRAIEEKGSDYIYEKYDGNDCLYVHDLNPYGESYEPTPGCIVGCALILGGLDAESFIGINEVSVSAALDELEKRGLVYASDGAMSYLGILQTNQDVGKTWGEANEKALKGLIWRTSAPHYRESEGDWAPDS